MIGRVPGYRDPVLHFDALHLAALREGGKIEEALATENEREVLIRAPPRVYSAHVAPCCWSAAFSPLPALSVNWIVGPCLASCSVYLGGNS